MPAASSSRSRKSNVSSITNAAATASSSTTSSILKSAFTPSRFQLSLFASVISGLDSHVLRIHDTGTGRLRCEHSAPPSAAITCLAWGNDNHVSQLHKEVQKKRKRVEQSAQLENGHQAGAPVLAFGTTTSEIHIYSPLESKPSGKLTGGHSQGIKDIKYDIYGTFQSIWSLGGDSRLVEWDTHTLQSIRTIPIVAGLPNAIRPFGTHVAYADHVVHLLDPQQSAPVAQFTASTNPVEHILFDPSRPSSPKPSLLTAAIHDPFVNVFSEGSTTLVGSLRTAAEVVLMDLYTDSRQTDSASSGQQAPQPLSMNNSALLVVNALGDLELFHEPYRFEALPGARSAATTKERMKARSRKATAQIHVTRSGEINDRVPLIGASFRDNFILFAWADGGVSVSFDCIQWRDAETDAILLAGDVRITRDKSTGIHALANVDIQLDGRSRVREESSAIVDGASMLIHEPQAQIIDISSAEEGSQSDDDKDVDDNQHDFLASKHIAADLIAKPIQNNLVQAAGHVDESSPDAAIARTDGATFSDLLRLKGTSPIDVTAVYETASTIQSGSGQAKPRKFLPSGLTLSTILTQSLRTNDQGMLETCFQVKDLQVIRATIERLDSKLAETLLQRLAERLHNKPGRAGGLMVWIQWTLVAHGGYLAGQPDTVSRLASLHTVIKERASSLQPLLALKGKLDMLEAQINIRKALPSTADPYNQATSDRIIYVEGQDEQNTNSVVETQWQSNGVSNALGLIDDDLAGESRNLDSQSSAVENGISSDDDDDEEGFFDEEASSTDEDSAASSADEDAEMEG